LCARCNAHGYRAHPGRAGRDALAKAREVAPDLIIMDIQLPHVSGLDLIRLLRADKQLAEVPIMAVTAYAGTGDEERVRAAGAQASVSKPISVVKFAETVEGLLPHEQQSLPIEDPEIPGDSVDGSRPDETGGQTA
jgi:two-component system cell cycle response regulator DivK